VPAMFPKAYRWVAELEEVAHFAGPGDESKIFRAIAALYDRLAEDFEGPKNEINALARFFEKAGAAKK
jgi:putative dehydrogenase